MSYVYPSRIDLFVVDQVTGEISVIKGKEGGSTPTAPAHTWPICSLQRTADRYPVAGDLVDLRPAAVTALDANTLAPSLESPGASHNVVFAAGQLQTDSLSVQAKRAEAVRYGIPVKFPARGQYNVRIRRTTADRTGNSQFDQATWSVLRSIKNEDPIAKPGLAKVALRIKATDQLSGVIDTFSCIAESVLPDWDSTTQSWITRRTSNPASIFRDVLQGAAMKLPVVDSRIDLAELQTWWQECQTNGYAYRAVIDYQSTPFEMLRNVAAVGRARFTMRDGLFSVVRDSAAILTSGVKQVITPRNSWDVKGEKSFAEIHGVTVKYINQALDYRQDEVTVYAAGYTSSNATKVDVIELPGVTIYEQAWKAANYYLAVATLRPETHSRMMDVEHLVVTSGDLIRVTDDVAMHGLSAGRISAIATDGSGNVTGITLDEVCAMEAGKTYAVRIRYATGGDLYRAIDTVAGEQTSLTFSVAIPPAQAPEVGDLVAFGETDQETAEKIVHHIEMGDDLTARIYYVDAAPGVYTADSGTVPAYNPQMTVPADIHAALPGVPVITGVISDETVMTRNPDGSVQYHIAVTVQPTAGTVPTEAIELQYKISTEQPPWTVIGPQPVGDPVLLTGPVERGTTYNLRARAVSRYGTVSDWISVDETVIGMSRLPSPVSNLRVENSTGDGVTFADVECHLVWDAPSGPWDDPARIDHYHVEVWDTSHTTLLHSEDVDQTRFDLTLAKNQALTGGPYRTFQAQVTVVDVFAGNSSPATITPVNPQSPQITGIAAVSEFGVARISWDEIADLALAGVEIHASQTPGFTPGAGTLQVVVPARTREHRLSLADGLWYIRAGAFDVFDKQGVTYSSDVSVTVSSTIDATNVTAFYEQISNLYPVPVTKGAVWTTDGTNLSWNAHELYYMGVKYSIAAGSTTGGNPFVYWDKAVSTTTYQETNNQTTFDNLDRSADQWQIAVNNGASFDLAWTAAANMVIGTAMIGKAAVQDANIGDIIQSAGFTWDVAGQNCVGWQFDKTGTLRLNAIEVRRTDGTLLMDVNGTDWAGVIGAGKPADNATVGATWGTDVNGIPPYFGGANMVPAAYSTFEGTTLPPVSYKATSVLPELDTTVAGPISSQTLRLTNLGTDGWCYLDASANGLNIPITPGKKWILSFYAKGDTASMSAQMYLHTKNGAGTDIWKVKSFTPSITGFNREFAILDLTSVVDGTGLNIRIDNDGPVGSKLWIDGVMLEPYVEGQTEPSPFVKPLPGAGKLALQNTADWGTDLAGVPANLASLTGAENINNQQIVINANGTLSGAGGGQVTPGGIGAETPSAAQAKADAAEAAAKNYTDANFVLQTSYNSDLANIQSQIDGNITSWFYDGVPTLANSPAVGWTTNADKDNHLGDLYYDNLTGYGYRFAKSGTTYSWNRIQDTDVTKALADAAKAQDTADQKRRVFVVQPIPPYDLGDLWDAGAVVKRCITAKLSGGTYNASDWVEIANYTTATSQLTDDAALGSTANWPQVIGTGKPADNATVGATIGVDLNRSNGSTVSLVDLLNSTGNLVVDPQFTMSTDSTDADYWLFSPNGGKVLDPTAGYNGGPGARLNALSAFIGLANNSKVPYTSGTPVFVRGRVFCSADLDNLSAVRISIAGYDSAGTYLGDAIYNLGSVATLGGWVEFSKKLSITNSAISYIRMRLDLTGTATVGYVVFDDLWMGFSEVGADVTSQNTSLDTANVNGTPASQITADIQQALNDASNAQSTADGKIQSFYQTTAPTSGMSVGDLWFDTNDGNHMYRYNGTTWVDSQDSKIGQALSSASNAQATADGKVTTFFSSTTPTAEGTGDLWYNNTNKLFKRWNGSSWAVVSNLTTATSQLTDDANLGQTANWQQVSGTGKPADNADVTNYNDTRVSNATLEAKFDAYGDYVEGVTPTSSATLTNPQFLTNGDYTISSSYASTGWGTTPELDYDLGASKYIGDIWIHFYAGGGRQYNYVVAISDDGVNWRNVVGDFANSVYELSRAAVDGYFPNGVGVQFPTIVPVNAFARYVKIVTNGNTFNAGNHWYGIRVFAKGGVPDPYLEALATRDAIRNDALTQSQVNAAAGWTTTPTDGADVTSQNTALDTANVNGVAAAQVQANADAAKTAVDNQSADGVFSVQEKAVWRIQWPGMLKNHDNIITQATTYGISAEAIFTNFTTTKNDLYTLLNVTHDIWAVTPVDTTITADELQVKTTAFYDKMALAVNRLAEYTRLADVVGAGAMAGIDQIDAANFATYIKHLNADAITAGTLTGRTIQTAVPGGKRFVVDSTTNEAHFYGDRGDGVIEELATIGIKTDGADTVIGSFGTVYSYKIGVKGLSHSSYGVYGRSSSYIGVRGYSSTSYGVYGSSYNSVAVAGDSTNSSGLYGSSTNHNAVVGNALTSTRYDFYASGVGINYGPFTGGHDGLVFLNTEMDPGDIVVDAEVVAKENISNCLLRLERSSIPNQKGVTGVLVAVAELEPLGAPRSLPYPWPEDYSLVWDRIVFNAVGEGQINVCAEGGDIEIGDLIVASSMPGKGMKQEDDIMRSCTVARAREAVTWTDEEKEAGVWKQIACIYHCG